MKTEKGFSLIEVMISMFILGLLLLAALGIAGSTGIRNERVKEKVQIIKSCSEVTEILLAMNWAEFVLQEDPPQPRPFTATRLPGNPTGFYTVTDISTTLEPASAPDQCFEIRVALTYNRQTETLITRRAIPGS